MKVLLITICIALLALFAYQVMSFPLGSNELQIPHADKDIAESIDYELPRFGLLSSIEQYSEITQRPLFVKGRFPASGTKALSKVTTVNELSHLILVGTARSTDVQIGIIADTKAKQMERLKVGENYKDWKIAEVSPDYVKFQNAEVEYKLFVTPIEGSRKAKHAKLISQLNKSKIDRAASAIRSYQRSADGDSVPEIDRPKQKVAGKIWNYNINTDQQKNHNKELDKSDVKLENKPVRKSPIKIPVEDEKNSSYYEGLGDDDLSDDSLDDWENITREISAEDFYDDEEITEDELQALEALGAKIFDD